MKNLYNLIKLSSQSHFIKNNFQNKLLLNNLIKFSFKEKKKIDKAVINPSTNIKSEFLNNNLIKSNNVQKSREEYLKEITENNKEVSILNKISKKITAISNFKIAMVGFSPFILMFIMTTFEVSRILLLSKPDFLEQLSYKLFMEKLNFNSITFKLCLICNLSFNFFISGLKISQYTKDMKDREFIQFSEDGFEKGTMLKLLKGISEFFPIFLMLIITFLIIKSRNYDYKYLILLIATNILNSYKINIPSFIDLLSKLRAFNLIGCFFLTLLFLLDKFYYNKFNENIMIDEEDENSIKELITKKQIEESEFIKIKNEMDLLLSNEEASLNIYE